MRLADGGRGGVVMFRYGADPAIVDFAVGHVSRSHVIEDDQVRSGFSVHGISGDGASVTVSLDDATIAALMTAAGEREASNDRLRPMPFSYRQLAEEAVCGRK